MHADDGSGRPPEQACLGIAAPGAVGPATHALLVPVDSGGKASYTTLTQDTQAAIARRSVTPPLSRRLRVNSPAVRAPAPRSAVLRAPRLSTSGPPAEALSTRPVRRAVRRHPSSRQGVPRCLRSSPRCSSVSAAWPRRAASPCCRPGARATAAPSRRCACGAATGPCGRRRARREPVPGLATSVRPPGRPRPAAGARRAPDAPR
jgi:hypothetical protein